MAAQVGNLQVRVGADIGDLQSRMRTARAEVAQAASVMDASLGRIGKSFGGVKKSAEESAQAFMKGRQAAEQLLGSIDPLYASQRRYDAELERANAMLRQGSLSAAEFAKVQSGLKMQLAQTSQGFVGATSSAGRMRMGAQQLSFQIGDVGQQFALGVRPMTIFIQQSGQVLQAMSLMGGGAKGLIGLLSNPYTQVLLAIGLSLGALALKHRETSKSIQELLKDMEKQREDTRKQEIANRLWADSLEGVRESMRKLNDEINRSFDTSLATPNVHIRQAQAGLDAEKQELQRLQAELRNLKSARADLEKEIVQPSSADVHVQEQTRKELEAVNKAIEETGRKINESVTKRIPEAARLLASAQVELQAQLAGQANDASKAISDFFDLIEAREKKFHPEIAAQSGVLSSIGAVRKAAEEANSAGLATKSTADALSSLIDELNSGKKQPEEFAKAVNKMADALTKAAKAAEAAKKAGTGEFTNFGLPVQGTITGRFGETRPGHTHAGIDIAVPSGTKVSATAPGTVVEVGTMPGYGNVVVIDHGGGTVSRYAHLSKFLTKKGQTVNAGDVIALSGGTKGAEGAGNSTGPHLHYEVRVGGKAVNPLGRYKTDTFAAQQKAMSAAQQVAGRDDNLLFQFQREQQQADMAILQAKRQLAGTAEERAKLDEQVIQLEHDMAKSEIDERVRRAQADYAAGKISADALKEVELQGQVLNARNDDLAALRRKAQTEEDLAKAEAANRQIVDQQYQFRIDGLQAEDRLVTTAEEHRRIQMEILDLEIDRKRKMLEGNLLEAQRNGATAEQIQLIKDQIDNLAAERAQGAAGIVNANKGPLDQYFAGVPRTIEEAREAMQQLEVQGIDGAINALTELRHGFGAFRDAAIRALDDVIAQLIRMQLMKLAFSLFGGATGSTSIIPLQGGAMSITDIPGFASGGSFTLGGMAGIDRNTLSLNGLPIARVSYGERVSISNDNSRGGGRGGDVTIHAPITIQGNASRETVDQAASVLRRRVAGAVRKGLS